MTRKRTLFIAVGFSLCLVGIVYGQRIAKETLLLLSGGHTTIYSDEYSEELFDDIFVGQSKANVIKQLGFPIEESIFDRGLEMPETVLEYSESATDSHYRLRLIFIIDDKVVEKVKDIHFD